MAELYVVNDEVTSEYMPSSESVKIDRKDVDNAKRYSLSGAKTAARYYQNMWDYWKNQSITASQNPLHSAANRAKFAAEAPKYHREWKVIKL